MVKINTIRKGSWLGNGDAYTFASESEPGKTHIAVFVDKHHDSAVCSCRGYQTHGYCWHTRWMFENA